MIVKHGVISSSRQNGASVVAGSLIYLESRNATSYPGTGTTWFDLSGNSNNATLVNGVGYSSSNMIFDGTNDYATQPLIISTASYSDYTVTVRAKSNITSTSLGSDRTVISAVQGSNNPFNFRVNPTGKLTVQFGGSLASSSLTTTTAVFDNTDRVFTFRKLGNVFSLFVGDTIEATTTISIGNANPTSPFEIGRFRSLNTGYYERNMSTVLIYGTGLSDAQIISNNSVIG